MNVELERKKPEDSRSMGCSLNPGPSDYEAGVRTSRSLSSVVCYQLVAKCQGFPQTVLRGRGVAQNNLCSSIN